jgi:hypothetical protein
MDAMIKKIFLSSMICLCMVTVNAQQMNWNRFAEDTLYYGKDYLPDQRHVTLLGPAQTWDFRSLKAPYALSRRIIISGEKEGTVYGNLVNGKQTDAIMLLNGKSTQVVQAVATNPVCPGNRLTYNLAPAYKPFFTGVLGEQYTYRGKMTTVFAWPRNIACSWVPPQLPDSCRITWTIEETTVVDAEGTLYLPTEVAQVYRQKVEVKRAPRIETRTGLLWRDVTSLVPGIRLISNVSFIRFVAASSGIQLVEIELNDVEEPVSIEFKTHPLVTRVFSEEPSKPDIFAYPNPSYDVVRFQLSDLPLGMYKLRIFNILGVPVKDVDIEVDDRRETIAVDLNEMQRGTYLFRLQDKAGRTIKTKRVVLIES